MSEETKNPVETMTETVTRTRKKVEAAAKAAVEDVKDATSLEQFLDHQRNALGEAGKALESLVPVAFREHGQAAVKEMVEGYRTLVNSTLDSLVDTVEKLKLNGDKEEAK